MDLFNPTDETLLIITSDCCNGQKFPRINFCFVHTLDMRHGVTANLERHHKGIVAFHQCRDKKKNKTKQGRGNESSIINRVAVQLVIIRAVDLINSK